MNLSINPKITPQNHNKQSNPSFGAVEITHFPDMCFIAISNKNSKLVKIDTQDGLSKKFQSTTAEVVTNALKKWKQNLLQSEHFEEIRGALTEIIDTAQAKFKDLPNNFSKDIKALFDEKKGIEGFSMIGENGEILSVLHQPEPTILKPQTDANGIPRRLIN